MKDTSGSMNPLDWNRADWIEVAQNAVYIVIGVILGKTIL